MNWRYKIRTSFSQNNTYKQCPTHWKLRYKDKLYSPEMSSALYFGTAVDNAIETLLKEYKSLETEAAKILYMTDNYVKVFEASWVTNIAFGNSTPVFDNPNVIYGYADFDADILSGSDIEQLQAWSSKDDPIEYYKSLVKIKKNPHIKLNAAELGFFNRASWLSMRRKGLILIESFKVQILPKITEILSTQCKGELKDPHQGDSVIGYLDMILKLEGYDKPIIFDLKTAARPYTQENIDLTEQLTLYAAMKGEEYDTDLVGYLVLCKNINKEETSICKKCGHKKDSSHRTCNNMVDGETEGKQIRCKGEWETKIELKPQVQILVKSKNQKEISDLLADYANIILAMKNDIVYRNTDKCTRWYGGKCPYYNLCHHDSMAGLIDKKRR